MRSNAWTEVVDVPHIDKEKNLLLLERAVNGGDQEKWELLLSNGFLINEVVCRHFPDGYELIGIAEEPVLIMLFC